MVHKKIAILAFSLAMAIGSPARAAEGDDAPGAQNEIKSGDTVEVVSDRAKFRAGRKVVATLPKGSQLQVKWVEDGWIGGELTVGGDKRIGWIRREDVKRTKAAPPIKPNPTPPAVKSTPAPPVKSTPAPPPVRPPPAPREARPKPPTRRASATLSQPPVVEEPVAKRPTVRQPGFFRVAGNAYARGGESTIDVLMVRNAEGAAQIKPSDDIGKLILIGKGVDNKTLKSLRGMKIRLLTIDGASITNSGLKYLEDIKGLRVLRLWSGGLSDTALARLKNVAQIEALDLAGANVRGTGLSYLKSLEGLRALVLGPAIEDAELKSVGDLSQLEELDLRSCRQITDAGLAHLEGLKSLQRIACPPQITDEAKQSLGQKLPKCEFFR